MQILSDRIKAMEESATLAMAAKARELKSKGIDIISLSLGEPDFKTPQYIQEGGIKAIQSGNYFAYPPVAGYQDLRQAIADKLNKDNNIPAKAENIVVSAGAKQSIANAMLCLINPGDEVIVFSPYWVSYAEIVKLAEGVPVFIKGSIENQFKATAEQLAKAITPKTRAVIYSSPCNPTGSVFTKEELKSFADVLKNRKDIYVIADEIYEYINFGEELVSMASFPEMYENTITVNGFSKGYAMTGWRVGYISAPVWIAKACEKIQGQITSGISSIAQRAAVTALTQKTDDIQKMADAYRRRRDMVLELLNEIPGVKTYLPTGAFYIFPDVSAYYGKSDGETTIKDGEDLSMYILNKAYVSVVTGGAFGEPNCIRLSFAASDEQLKEAIKRIKEVLSKLK